MGYKPTTAPSLRIPPYIFTSSMDKKKRKNIFCSVIKCHSLVLDVFLTAVAQVAVFSVVYVFKSQNIKWEFQKASVLSDRRYLMRSFSWDKCGIMEFCLVRWTVKRCSNVEFFFSLNGDT